MTGVARQRGRGRQSHMTTQDSFESRVTTHARGRQVVIHRLDALTRAPGPYTSWNASQFLEEEAVELQESDEEMLVEEISIDGMCGVY